MSEIPERRWIDPLGFELECSPSFADAMSSQLAARARAEHDIDLERGFALTLDDLASAVEVTDRGISVVDVPLPGLDGDSEAVTIAWYHTTDNHTPTVEVTDDGISVVDVLLIGLDGVAEEATIAWYNTAGDHTLVAPADPVDERQDVSLLFWWHEFPEPEELERYRSCPPLVETSARVRWHVVCWPEVEIRLAAESDPSSDWIEAAIAIVRDVVEQWNAQDGPGVIHHWALPERIPSGEYMIRVDFGGAPMAVLGTLLDRLDTLSDPPLRHIMVCAVGTPRDALSHSAR